jgi:general secretion pathway protein M
MNWLQARSARERQVLAGAALLLAALLLYLLAWEPLAQREHELAARIAQQRTQLAWLVDAASEARTLTRRARVPEAQDGASLLSVIDRSAAQAGLGAALQRLAPEGDQGVRVWLDDASYAATLQWLDALGGYGIHVVSVQMEGHATRGRITARLLLGRAA